MLDLRIIPFLSAFLYDESQGNVKSESAGICSQGGLEHSNPAGRLAWENILLIIYQYQWRKKPFFVLKEGFQAERFTPPPEPERTSVMEFTLDTGVWQAFQDACAALGITANDCLTTWLCFLRKAESYQAVKKLMI